MPEKVREEFRLTWKRSGKVSQARLFATRKGIEKRREILAEEKPALEYLRMESRPVGKWKPITQETNDGSNL